MSWSPIPLDTTSNVGISESSGVWTSSPTSTWGHRAKSSENYDDTQTIRFTASSSTLVMAGYGVDPFGSGYSDIEYAWYYTSVENKWYIYESGSDILFLTGSYSDTVKIVRDGTTIKYYHNDVLKRTVTGTTTNDMYFHTVFGSGGSITPEKEVASSGGGGSSGGEDPPTQYTDGDAKAHAHLKPLHIFRRQRDWF